MGLFKPKHLTVFLAFYTMTDKSAVLPRDEEGWNERVHFVLEPLIRRHYYERLRPPQKWNYLFIHFEPSSLPIHFDFRDESTNEILYQDRFEEVCINLMSAARSYLQGANPSYKQDMLDDGLADMHYDWFSKMNMIVLSSVFPGYSKWGNETFKGS